MNSRLAHFSVSPVFFGTLAILVGTGVGLISVLFPNPLVPAGLLIAGVVIIWIAEWPEWGLLALVFVMYTLLSDVVYRSFDFISMGDTLVIVLSVLIILRWFLTERQPLGWQRPLFLISVYILVNGLSLFYARDFDLTLDAWVALVKNVAICFIIILLLQEAIILHRMVWTLLLAGIFLGTISVIQYLTGASNDTFGGFAVAIQANIINGFGTRLTGPLGDPNYYAQILLPILPLAFDRLWNERGIILKLLAGWALLACSLTFVFTFSRGGFLGLALVVVLMLMVYRPPLMAILTAVVFLILFLPFVPANYWERMGTISDAIGLGDNPLAEGSFRGRISEITVGILMFAEHPILGVGFSNYEAHYLDYSRTIGVDPRRQDREAHNRYLETAAETGIVGLVALGALLFGMFASVFEAKRYFILTHQLGYARMNLAFGIGLAGYLVTGIFLHDAFPRYFWLIAGIAFALSNTGRHEWLKQQAHH